MLKYLVNSFWSPVQILFSMAVVHRIVAIGMSCYVLTFFGGWNRWSGLELCCQEYNCYWNESFCQFCQMLIVFVKDLVQCLRRAPFYLILFLVGLMLAKVARHRHIGKSYLLSERN